MKNNPGSTRRQIQAGLKLTEGSISARVAELLEEGLLVQPGTTATNTSGVRAKALFIGNGDAGNPRDRVRVSIDILVDANGRYYAEAMVEGSSSHVPSSARVIHTKKVTVAVPKLKDIVDEPVRINTPNELTIEGSYTILK